jgi:C1A family cysteine protease
VKRHHGTGRDRASLRDWKYRPDPSATRRLPASVDLRRHCPPIYDQLHLNSCSANALAAALRYDELKAGHRSHDLPSRLFIYYNERVVAGVTDENTPVSLRDGYRTIAKLGVCSERMWPYDVRRFRRKPPLACYRAARRHVAIEYYRLRRAISHLRTCLAQRYPFVFALAVHASMLTRAVGRTGVLSVPNHRDAFVGGHAVVAVGYQMATRRIIFRNSWGRSWGDRGYGYMPFAFIASAALTWDFWTMRRVS